MGFLIRSNWCGIFNRVYYTQSMKDIKANGKAVQANTTVVLHRLKVGLPKNRYTGKIIITNIGIPLDAEKDVV